MRYEGRWNDSPNNCCSADTIEGVVSCMCSMTSGKGNIYIYQFQDRNSPQFIKIIEIID